LTTIKSCVIVFSGNPTKQLGIRRWGCLILSTKGRYGVKAAFDLALHYGQGPVPLKQIAERQDISVTYLEQLMAVLRKDGIVRSVRGAQGGYMLSGDPRSINIGDILHSLEGPMAPSECVLDDQDNECIRADYCVTRLLWEKIKESIDSVINSISLQDMVDDYNRMGNNYLEEKGEDNCGKKSVSR
jgi:Rrf2 family cysteine metabolism transcriptional repressor